MRTYLLEGWFQPGRPTGPAFQQALAAHHQYIGQQVAQGRVLLAGPIPEDPQRGGILVVKSGDIDTFCQADPFVQLGVQTYKITPFRVFDGQAAVKAWAE